MDDFKCRVIRSFDNLKLIEINQAIGDKINIYINEDPVWDYWIDHLYKNGLTPEYLEFVEKFNSKKTNRFF